MNSRFDVLFVVFCVTHIVLMLAINNLLITEDVYYNQFSDQMSFETINDLINTRDKWSWIPYVLVPVFYLLKFLLVVICIAAGAFLFNVQVDLKTLFKIALVSEFVLILPVVIKLFWFALIDTGYNLNDLQYFSPLSALNFFDASKLEAWQIYPLNLLNVFEIAYIFTLAYLLCGAIDTNFSKSLRLVFSSYGAGLLIWSIFVAFLTVSLTTG